MLPPLIGLFFSTAENSFLQFQAEDFVSDKVMEIPEYFVYCGIFIMHSRVKRYGQIAKGEFFEVPIILACQPVSAGQFVAGPMGESYKKFVNDV